MSYFPENVLVEIFTLADGLPTWTNIAGSIPSPIMVQMGFTDVGPLNRLAPGGDMRFDLTNRDSSYDPSSTFYKGQKIRLRVKYGSLIKTKFFGYIDTIGLDVGTWGSQLAHVVAIDWLSLAAITPVRAIPGLTNTTIDAAVTMLLTQMQVQPERLDFEIGEINLPYVFNQITPNSTVYSELQNLVMGEWGYIYLRDGGETLKIENSMSRIGDGSDYKTTSYYLNDGVAEEFLLEDGTNFLLEDGTNFLLEGEPTPATFNSDLDEEYTDLKINHGDNLINRINASAIPVIVGGSTVVLYPFDIASGSKAVLIPPNNANTPYVFQGQYKDPTAGGTQISGENIVTPVVTTDWKFNSAADGTGSDLSANITINLVAGQSGFKASIINVGPPGYLTKFNIRGTPIYRYNPIETVLQDQRSIWDYGDYSLQFIRQYGATSDDIRPFVFRLLLRDRKPRTIASNPKFNAWDELDHLAGFLILDIGDQIRLASTKPATDSLYYIQGMKFSIKPGSEQITFDYVTEESLSGALPEITEIAIEQTAKNQAVNFGYLPLIGDLVYMTICLRVWVESIVTPNRILFWSTNPVPCGLSMQTGGAALEYAFQKPFSGGTMNARAATAIGSPLSQWISVIITYDASLPTNTPAIYENGSSLTVTPDPESGTPVSQAGAPFVLGNFFSAGVFTGNGLEGKYEDVAIYNRLLSAAEIATIYNSGTRLPFGDYPLSGLKFFFGGMDDSVYASRLDDVLVESDTLYELVNGFTGQAIDGPTLREVA